MKHEPPESPLANHPPGFHWRRFLGACGGAGAKCRWHKAFRQNTTTLKGADAKAFLQASCSTDSCRPGVTHHGSVATSSVQASMCSSSAQLANSLSICALETGCEHQPNSGVSSRSSYLEANAASFRADVSDQLSSPEYVKPVPLVDLAIAEDETSAGTVSLHKRMHVALSASSLRDHAQCDPAMRIRHLKPLSYGSDSVVYKGTWQGLLFAVKFMLYRGSDPAGLQRRVSTLLAAQCMPQRSHLARVYACDLSEVVYADPPRTPPQPSPAEPLHQQQQQPVGGKHVDGVTAPSSPGPDLTVRPFFPEELDAEGKPCSPPNESVLAVDADAATGGGACLGGCGGGSCGSGRPRRGSACERFHFSSAIFSESPADDPVASSPIGACSSGVPGPTLHGLLDYLGARPGDYLLHCVSELASGGNLWHGIRSGAYDSHGPMGPPGAVRTVLHTARGIAQGLHQLHSSGEVHGGLTPGNVLLLWGQPARADGPDGGEPASTASAGGGGGDSRGLHKRRSLTARVADCGMRRLVLGAEWRCRLESNPELRSCTAPELLLSPPEQQQAEPLGAPALEAAGRVVASTFAGRDIEWLPCHDVYSFGAVLYTMCTGHRRRCSDSEAASAKVASAAAPASWPDHVWHPLRNLGNACMSPDPASRPSSGEIVRALLVLEQRLHNSGGHTRGFRLQRSPSLGSVSGPLGRAVDMGSLAAAPVDAIGLCGLPLAVLPPPQIGGARGGRRGSGPAAGFSAAAEGAVAAAATILHATLEEADPVDDVDVDGGGGGGGGGRNIRLDQTAPALGGPMHFVGARHFARSSLPEVLIRSSVDAREMQAQACY